MRIWQWVEKLSPFLIIIILSIFAWKALLLSGYFSMHDDQQVVRLFEFNKSLLAGQFPVRWVAGLGFGYGYALFNFYPPLVYYVGELFHLIGFGFIDSVKIVWFLAIVGSGFAMYFLAKNLFGKTAGIIAALFYIYAPYHAVDAYIRGALAELSSFVWLPLILLFAHQTAKFGKLKHALWTGFFLALLMLTHNLIFLPFFGIFLFWFLGVALIYGKRKDWKLIIYHLSLIILLTFGLTAFFWLPALWEKQFTLVDSLLIKNLASYKIHFLCPEQLWQSTWGFGGSVPGCLDGVSFKIGKLHVLVSILALGVAFVNKKHRGLILTAVSCLLIAVFMTTSYSSFIWDNIKELWYLQFPWRFLEFAVLFSSLLAGSLVLISENKIFKTFVAAVLVLLLLFQNAKLFTPQKHFLTATDQLLTSDEKIKWEVSATSFEYMPKGVATKTTNLGILWIDIDKSEIKKQKIKTKNFTAISEEFAPNKFKVIGSSKNGGLIEVQITNFPGWKVWVDGAEVEIKDNNKYKLITIKVPKGEHEIYGKFENTPVRTLGNLISLICLISLVIFIYGTRRNSQ